MKLFRYTFMFGLLTGIVISASNLDSRAMEALNEGRFLVKAVFVDSEGVKWFGTNRGLCRFDDLTWRYYTDGDHLAGNFVNALSFEETTSGPGLWVATDEGVSLLLFDSQGVTGSSSYTATDGLLDDAVTGVAVDSRNGKFFGSAGGITWYHDGIMDHLTYGQYPGSIFDVPVRQLEMCNDTLYIAQDGGIGRFVSGVDGITGATRWESSYGVSPYSGNIRSIMVNGINQQYFGTDVGVETHTGYEAKQNWDLLTMADGLVDNDVISIAEDSEGGLWFGTYGGVSHLAGDSWTSYTTADGLLNDTVYDIGFDLDGSVWFGTASGACRLSGGVFQDFITAIPEKVVPEWQFSALYNRAGGTLHLSYALDTPGTVSARLYGISGILAGQWNNLPGIAGNNMVEVPLDGQFQGGPASGIHVIQLIHGNRVGTQKIVITR